MKLDPLIRRELEISGLPWRIDPGKKHDKLFIGNRLVMVLPRSKKRPDPGSYARNNARANVRRAIRAALGVTP
jgi:hypothetical protein